MSDVIIVAIISAIFFAISSIAATVSVINTVKTNKKNYKLSLKANKLQEELIRIQACERILGWCDVNKYINVIINKMNDDRFVPDCIISVFTRDSIIASMLSKEFNKNIPIFVGMLVLGGKKEKAKHTGFTIIELSNTDEDSKTAYILLQENLPIKSSNKILIIRDHIASGVSKNNLINYFEDKYKIKHKNIKTACIACSESVREKPDYFCFHSNNIWFTWGKCY